MLAGWVLLWGGGRGQGGLGFHCQQGIGQVSSCQLEWGEVSGGVLSSVQLELCCKKSTITMAGPRGSQVPREDFSPKVHF